MLVVAGQGFLENGTYACSFRTVTPNGTTAVEVIADYSVYQRGFAVLPNPGYSPKHSPRPFCPNDTTGVEVMAHH